MAPQKKQGNCSCNGFFNSPTAHYDLPKDKIPYQRRMIRKITI